MSAKAALRTLFCEKIYLTPDIRLAFTAFVLWQPGRALRFKSGVEKNS